MDIDVQIQNKLKIKKYEEATEILYNYLKEINLNSETGYVAWQTFADKISYTIKKDMGDDEFIRFWEQLLDYFQNELQQHYKSELHKGMIYFRLAFISLKGDFNKAWAYFKKAQEEIIRWEHEHGKNIDEAKKFAMTQSSYVALCFLETIKVSSITDIFEIDRFVKNIFPLAFDSAIMNRVVSPEQVQNAMRKLVNQHDFDDILKIKNELDKVSMNGLPISSIALSGSLIESIILSILKSKHNVTSIMIGNRSKHINDVELGILYCKGCSKNIFPNDTIRLCIKLIQYFRNRIHPGHEIFKRKYRTTPSVGRTIRNLVDIILIEWAKNIE